MSTDIKRIVGYHVVDLLLSSGQKLGMGTGSTALWAMKRLAEKLASGELRDVKIVATSSQTLTELQDLGIQVYSMNDPAIGGEVDLAIDGADEVDPDFCLIKGGGAAHTLEKIVEYNAKDFYVIVDESKLVEELGSSYPVPLEVIPEARLAVMKRVRALGAEVEVRKAQRKAGPVISDNGNLILDARFPGSIRARTGRSPGELEAEIQRIPGLVEVGIFSCPVKGLFVGRKNGSIDFIPGKLTG